MHANPKEGSMRVARVMTRNVVSIPSSATIFEAAERLVGSGVSAMPVVDNTGRMVGIISEADLVRRTEIGTQPHKSWLARVFADKTTAAREYVALHARHVTDAMSKPVITVGEDDTLDRVAELMAKHNLKRLPVVKDGDFVVGTVSRANLLRLLLSRESMAADSQVPDDQIRQKVEAAVSQRLWTSPWPTNVIVDGGIVHLWGAVPSDSAADAYRVAAENVPGVKQVKNHLRAVPTSVLMGI
jgi:CBS domain-containing protein